MKFYLNNFSMPLLKNKIVYPGYDESMKLKNNAN